MSDEPTQTPANQPDPTIKSTDTSVDTAASAEPSTEAAGSVVTPSISSDDSVTDVKDALPDAASDTSEPETSVEPAATTPDPIATPEPAATPAPTSPAGDGTDNTPVFSPVRGPGRGKKWLVGILIIVILAATAIGAYALLHHKSQPVATKHDIPVLTYALREAGPLKAYPLSTNTGGATDVNAQLFEGLVRYDSRTRIVPQLATGWTNPNDTEWVFTLRQGVIFHSGRPFTANDVKVSLDYAVAHQNDDGHALGVSLASTIKSVDVVSADKVKITTDGPDPTLLNRLASLYIFDAKATPGDADAGTGPYTVKPGTTLNDNGVDLVAVKDYWGGHVYTKEVKITKMTNLTTMQHDTAAGKFDLAGDFSDSALAQLKPKHTVSVEDLGVSFVVLNTLRADSPLHSLKARQAATYALDVPAILKANHTRGQQVSQLVPSAIPGYDPSIHATPYNPAKAKQLLASVPNASAPLELQYPTGDDAPVKEIVKQLNAVGFNVHTTAVDDFNTLISAGLGGKTDMFFIGYTSDTLDGLDILENVLVGNNDYSNDQVDSLADQASTTLDPTARIALLQKIARLAASDVPVLPLYTQTNVYSLQKPYHVTPDIPGSQLGVYFWKVYQD